MAALDLIVIVILLFSILAGCLRGFVYEVITLFGWVMAFFLARWFAPEVALWIQDSIDNVSLSMAIAFGGIFIAVLFLNGILAFALKEVFAKSVLRPADRSLGGLFGILRGVICLMVFTLVVHILGWQNEPWWRQSKTAPMLDEIMQASQPFLRDVFDFDQEKLESQIAEHVKGGLQDKIQDAIRLGNERQGATELDENQEIPANKNAVKDTI